jgi:hypothetical protein
VLNIHTMDVSNNTDDQFKKSAIYTVGSVSDPH